MENEAEVHSSVLFKFPFHLKTPFISNNITIHLFIVELYFLNWVYVHVK